MTRPIKFRAISIKYGGWVYGWVEFLTHAFGGQTAMMHEFSDWGLNTSHDVDIKTVGQFTGLLDKHGKEIYEGDIFQDEEDGNYDFVEWSKYWNGWATNQWFGSQELAEQGPDLEIIGNIYQNPELLK